ncbi:MAG: RDD family protein [Blastocatellia bacterium]|jgi:uncharacterized RDD family membrane protein YckC
MSTARRGEEKRELTIGLADEAGSLLRRRGIAFLLDYIATLLILALSLVIASYIKRHWPLFRVDEALVVPGFLALATRLLHATALAGIEAAGVTSAISWLGIFLTAGWVFYNWVYVYAHDQQSLGKYFIGLRIRRLDGAPMSYGAAARRHLIGYPVSILSLGLGLLPILIDPRGRGWHDRIAGTSVESD